MSCLSRALVPVLVVVASMSVAGADPPPTCVTGEGPGAVLQDDAGSGTDAGDSLAASLSLPGDASWAGGLDLPNGDGPGDLADVYRVEVDASAREVMVELQSYSVPEVYERLLVVDVFLPGSDVPVVSVPLGADRQHVPALPGAWSFTVRYAALQPGEGCEPSDVPVGAPSEVSTLVKMYTLYVGCDPVCVPDGT